MKISFGDRTVGAGQPCFVIAELSANHNGSLGKAMELIEHAARAGADAVKLQTYTADTITLDCSSRYFQISGGTQWDGQTLHALYDQAHTPWEWHWPLQEQAVKHGLVFLSTPFDSTAVDFLETLGVSLYKIASFELIDIPLVEKVAQTGKPMIVSTGMGSEAEISEALEAARRQGNDQVILLKCVSNYPADPGDMNIASMVEMRKRFGVPVGLSDHSLSHLPPTVAAALGASVIEKHLIADRSEGGPDSAFSLEPTEFAEMVRVVREAERVLGRSEIEPPETECVNRIFRKSLFVSRDVQCGDIVNPENVRSVRPGHGIEPKYLKTVMGREFRRDLIKGTPLSFEDLE